MRNSTSDYDEYIAALIGLGWDRHWITHNHTALREAFRNNPVPFPPPPAPVRNVDRYDEI